MNTPKNFFDKVQNRIKNDQAKGAQRAMLEELFNDYYIRRGDVYKMNFFRGIFFGLGSVIGGTLVVALIIWILSLFVDIPVIGNFLQDIKNSIHVR